jgi:hypothetical protein
MLENRAATIRQPSLARALGVELPSRQRARRTNDPLATIETNTARGRRIADLVRAYLKALGNPTDIERQAAVIAADELQVLAEEARAAALKSGSPDLDQVERVQGAADRAVRRLGIKPGAARSNEPDLATYLSQITTESEDADASSGGPSAETPAEAETPTNEPAGLAGEAE